LKILEENRKETALPPLNLGARAIRNSQSSMSFKNASSSITDVTDARATLVKSEFAISKRNYSSIIGSRVNSMHTRTVLGKRTNEERDSLNRRSIYRRQNPHIDSNTYMFSYVVVDVLKQGSTFVSRVHF
jgi:hypothetical protein